MSKKCGGFVMISDSFLQDLQERYQRETRPVCRLTYPHQPDYIGISKDTFMNCINNLNRRVRKQTYDVLYTWCYGDE